MPLTLRDIVARGTPLEWFESVAIVQELGASVLTRSGTGEQPRVPDLAGAELKPDGSVVVTDAGEGEQAPVFRLAHVLNTLLASGSPPVQLRLLVLTALSPEPTHRSLGELMAALEYFERPDRRNVNRLVYERALLLPASEVEVPPLPEKPAEPKRPAPSPAVLERRRKVIEIAAVLVVATVLVGAGWWWLSRPSGAKVLDDTTQTVSRAVSSAVGAIKGTFGKKPEAPVVVEAAPAPIARQTPPKRASRPIQPARSLAQRGMAPIVALAPTIERTTWTEPAEKFDETIYLNIPAAEPPGAGVAVVYSESDPDVIAPVSVHPKLPTEPPAGVGPGELTRLEIVVSETGEVDSVKIVAGPRRTTDGMMLSAVKAWRFQPALRNGRPVPYRRLVWLTNP